jgi:hypothetical protein
MKPFFGYHSPSFSDPGMADIDRFDSLTKRVLAVEAAGFDLVTVMDHFYQIGVAGREEEPMLEVYSTLAGFTGFIFRNMELTPDDIPLAAELLKLMS